MEALFVFLKEYVVDKVVDFLLELILKLLRNRSVLALIAIYSALIFSQYWIFGVLLLTWVVQDLFKKQTYMMEVITRDQKPLLYWVTLVTWLILGLLSFEVIQEFLYSRV